jgi:hypothetical protein
MAISTQQSIAVTVGNIDNIQYISHIIFKEIKNGEGNRSVAY